jgi:hypothetical protein
MMNNSSAELREWAARCEDAAALTTDENQRASLFRKCAALRALADSEDWLARQLVDRGTARADGSSTPDQSQAAE